MLASHLFLVPRKGLEPPRSYPLVPETSASTNSATRAFQEVLDRIIKTNSFNQSIPIGVELHARLLRRTAAHEPVDSPAVRGIRRHAARRAGQEVRDLNQTRLRSAGTEMQKGQHFHAGPSHILGAQEGTRTPTELPAST